MKLRTKIFIPVNILLFILVGGFTYLLIDLNANKESLTGTISRMEVNNKSIERLEELQNQLDFYVLAFRFDQNETYLKTIVASQAEITVVLNELQKEATDPLEREYLKAYINSREGVEQLQADLIRDTQIYNLNAELRDFAKWDIKTRITNAALKDLNFYNFSRIERNTISPQKLIDRIIALILLVSGLVILLVVAFYYYLREIITKPIIALSETMTKISEGNFQANLKVKTGDEIGDLTAVFNKMASRLGQYYRRLQEELQKKTSEIALREELGIRKDDFISMASHELKTPITSLKLFTSIVQDLFVEKKLDEIPKYLGRIDSQAERLNELVSDLLDVARIQSGKLDHKKEVFYLDDLVRENIAGMQLILARHKIELGEIPRANVFADKNRIEQVLTNLISNAAKYSPKADRIMVGLALKGGMAVVEVKDFGIGITLDHQSQVFDKFFRARDTVDKTFPGLGMGLYISREILKRNDGDIWLKSEPGRGSTFYFSLPIFNSKS